ncbi:Autophagy protein 22 [Recurvomyces mirabilis]|uniref:Autophagy-related protein n=1 Tax=Recurvomyces mirabilis TaxID=574656 RepID=A0AAE0WTA4_9PEZI|nr:Autophagy protein 22 [Recurvomyces mirabilis]KAK5159281.1 Autophagy protein 22 [Recurvomyces mirabilis]
MVPRHELHPVQPHVFSTDHTSSDPSSHSSRSDTNDADDERSISSSQTSSMRSLNHDDNAVTGPRQPAYPGEDTRPTSRKELAGFYAYSFAAEVFVVCGLGAFIPITLEELARASSTAVLADDHSQPCRSPRNPLGPEGPSMSLRGFNANKEHGHQCVIQLLGHEVNTASFAMYTFSISVLIQALVVITMSGAADHGRFRKTLLITFAIVGSVVTMLFILVTPTVYLLGSLWAIIGNVCFGASFVTLNSFLPLLVRHYRLETPGDEAGARLLDEYDEQLPNDQTSPNSLMPDGSTDPTEGLLPGEHTAPFSASYAAASANSQLSTKISSYGVGIGYTAAVLVQIISIFILMATHQTLFSLRLVLFFIGGWWLVFTFPAALWLRPRPGPPLSAGKDGKPRSWASYIGYSWVNLGKTVIRARRLKDVMLFLAAWFMISDGIATVSGTAILFAKTTLRMEGSALAFINVIVTLSGIAGAFTWSTVSRMMELKPSQTILICICLFELIPLYGLLGYIPAIQRFGSFGLQQPWEMYPLGAVYGLVLGGLSSYCRSLFGELIPPGSEAAFYALYAITDKGSSIFGPAIVGAITNATGDIRPAFFFLAVLIGLPIPIMCLVNVERGRREAIALARDTTALSHELSNEDATSE